MSNDRCTAIEARLGAFESQVAQRTESRDKAQDQLWEAIAELETKLGIATSAVTRLESVKPVSAIALWGPSIATLVLVGSLAYLVMTLSISPLDRKGAELAEDIRHVQDDMTGAIKVLMDRQDDVRQRLSRIEGGQPYLDGWLRDVDQTGSRKWVGQCKQ